MIVDAVKSVRFRPSWLTLLMLSGLVLMLLGHLGRSSWYWIILPAVAFGVSLSADVARSRIAGKAAPAIAQPGRLDVDNIHDYVWEGDE